MNDTVQPPATTGHPTEAEGMYLFFRDVCGGFDVTRFWLPDGSPDLEAAREYSESLREKLGDLIDEKVSVSQRVNRVTVKVIA